MFDMDEMKRALTGPSYRMPSNMTREDRRAWAKSNHKSYGLTQEKANRISKNTEKAYINKYRGAIMTFKDQLQRDVNNVFLNPSEFADIVVIDGIPFACIIYEDEFTHEMARTIQLDGVFIQNTHILINSDSIKTPPVDGQKIKIKNKFYYVSDVQNEQGVLHITVSANQS